jgi:hypothetical protein
VNRLSAGVEFGPPQRGRDATSREARGRQCDSPGCSTVLSTYNRSRTCYLHTMPESSRDLEELERLKRWADQRKRSPRVSDTDEVMR